MKIFLVAPKSISNHRIPGQSFRYDYAFWNFYFPLLSLGHDVTFFDTSQFGDEELNQLIELKKPELLFCITTGDTRYCPKEPWQTIIDETKKGRLKTFNWFCDDTWRFDSFSREVCNYFHICSTPEKKFIEKYKDIGYDNILYATWHANADFYSNLNVKKENLLSFVGAIRGDRGTFIEAIEELMSVHHPKNASFEDLVHTYANSYIGINFSKNSNNNKTQMKARMFEIPASGTLLFTEYHDNIEECFDINKEIVTFQTVEEMIDKLIFLWGHPSGTNFIEKIALAGHNRFMKEHNSKIRLGKLLQQIGDL